VGHADADADADAGGLDAAQGQGGGNRKRKRGPAKEPSLAELTKQLVLRYARNGQNVALVGLSEDGVLEMEGGAPLQPGAISALRAVAAAGSAACTNALLADATRPALNLAGARDELDRVFRESGWRLV
jgi:hypothetical protein